MTKPGDLLVGESGRKYRLAEPLFAQTSSTPPRVWKAVDEEDGKREFVVKEPIQMQNQFKESPFIRKMLDYIPQSVSNKPMMVLQAFERSLWNARNRRELTINEIKWIMKAVLIAVWTIHREGLPSVREITSLAYRSPEVYFGKPWTSGTDIWSWGIVYCHLLEARTDITSPGMYDSICKGTMEEKTDAVRGMIAQDFDLKSLPFYTDDARSSKLLPTDQPPQKEEDWWGERLLRKGVAAEEIAFLINVLDPDPRERPSAEEIIRSGYLEIIETNSS
ncbi:kinase-like protein [Tothia fuscella]|uniref:Kinase-like protein n=1 Tax=Tothia fuscella TaxID=1048955 RepID=A0A9P4P2P7_9PEZI|nr:kinase-like protein [Tothia fuscella]